LDPEYLLARKLTGVPDVVYNTDCGPNKVRNHCGFPLIDYELGLDIGIQRAR
jgi:hypothetical protein